jgi:DNA-binding winged helix-turn-helix (wHTH) protein
MAASLRYRFEDHVFDAGTGELWTAGFRRLLPPQQAAVLACLLGHGGKLVGRHELYVRLWGETHADVEHGLNFCIRRLRRALGDDARDPRYIETIRHRGYRWVAPIEELNDMNAIRSSVAAVMLTASLAASDTAAPGLAPSHSQAAPRCADLPMGGWLDFWVGEWIVRIGDQRVGSSRIERVLDGCAIIEHWEDARGSTGKSLFYPAPPNGVWHQIWVTDRAALPGGVKQKRLIARYPGGGVRFQGEVTTPDGLVLDRTTLTPRGDGTVRQQIEISRDGGTTWAAGFDAVYHRSRR